LNLGISLWDRGERQEALAIFDSFIDLYNGSADRLTPEDLMAVGVAVRYLGVTDPDLYQDALMAFDDAARADPDDPRPALFAGELFLEKYRATDARDSFRPVLERNPRHPRALLGQARILDFEGAGGALALIQEALEVNPRYTDGRAFLARLHLKTGDYEEAREAASKALDVNPAHLQALSILAAACFLSGDLDGYEGARSRIHGINPSYAGLYTTVAELAVDQRMYQTAVEFAGRAIALDSMSWRSFGVLGMNQLRTGAIEAGRRNLEVAFSGDPYNPWYKNTLDLLDTFDRYRTVETDHFQLFLFEGEADLLAPYAGPVAEEAFDALRSRYGAEPPTPIRLEVFPSHADFSVRTLGLTGLGALGVSFGSTLVLDSPSARDPGEFNWVSTLWHEVAHAFHLAMTDHRVPRWFTEGLAVHEQHKARGDWGLKATPAWLNAYASGRLLSVSRLNQGFIRPEYPEQVVFSYFQASLVFELIEGRWGLETILAMLAGYRDGKTDEEVFGEFLGQSPELFDRTFDEYVERRFGDRIRAVEPVGEGVETVFHPGRSVDLEGLRRNVLRSPGSFLARLALGKALLEAGREVEAEAELLEAQRLFPEYGGPDSPYLYLARIHEERGEKAQAALALQRLGGLGENQLSAHTHEARLRAELGESAAAARALQKAVEISPFDMDAHRTLAELYQDLEEHEGAVLERRAILALDPPDRADAHYRLARALLSAGDPSQARREVLRALEIAPSFDAALELLLELRGGER
jgi:tetratricopeptide (TPR) repeat protein